MGISFCIATYNRLPHLKCLLNSIFEGFGDYPYEVIVADGGSTDGSLEYMRNLANIKLIEQKKLTGAIKAFNECFKNAKYEYLCPLSDDLIIIPKVIVKACELMNKEEQIGLVSPKLQEPTYGNLTGVTIRIDKYRTLLPKAFILRSSILKEINYFDEKFRTYFADDDSPLTMLKLGYTIIFTKEIGIKHSRLKDEEENVAREITIKKLKSGNEIEYFNKKWKPLEDNLKKYKINKSLFFKKLSSMMYYSEKLRPFIKINNKLSMKLHDWFLEQTVVFKDRKYSHLKDFFLAQKYPEEVISSLR